MTWAARVAANKKNSLSQANGAMMNNQKDQVQGGSADVRSKSLGTADDSVVFKPEAANGAPVKNLTKTGLSFGNFSNDQNIVNPVPVHRVNAPVPVAASAVLQNYPRTMSAPPKIDEQMKAARMKSVENQDKIDPSIGSTGTTVPGLPSKANPQTQGTTTNYENSTAPQMGMQFVPANPYYYPDMSMYGMGQFNYSRFPVYYPSQQVLPNGSVAQNKAVPIKGAGSSSVPPIPTPKKSSAIKIKNPNTQEEVDLKAILKDKPVSAERSLSPVKKTKPTLVAPQSDVVSTTSDQTSNITIPVVAQKVAVTPRSSAIKIIDPSKNEVVNFSEVLKKEKEQAQKHQVSQVLPQENIKVVMPTQSVKFAQPEQISKLSPGAESLDTAEDTLVSPSFGDSLDETSVMSDESEEGEIPEPVVLTTNEGINYPASLKTFIPNLTSKRYSKEFLMAFECLDLPKPDELPTMDELKGEERSYKSGSGDRRSFLSSGRSGTGRSFDYSGRDRYSESKGSGKSRKGSQRQSGQRGSASSSRPSKFQPPVELLVKSETAWIPHNQQKKKNEDLVEVTSRQVKGLLNKLTVEKFDVVSERIINIGIIDEHVLLSVISIIFEKALDEPGFGAMYASLCLKISQELYNVQKWTGQGPKNAFRVTLINKCQQEFQKNSKWSEEDGTSVEERKSRRKMLESLSAEEKLKFAEEEYERAKLKRRVLGNIRFVGELFMKGLIGERIMHSCVLQLLSNVSDPEEEDIESLCKLMTTIGAKIDHEAARPHMETYFARITEISNNRKLSSRIRFMLMDLLDLRKNGWKARVEVAVPKTIAEIHREAERKLAEENAEKLRMSRGSKGGSGSNRSSITAKSMQSRSQDVRSSLSKDDNKRNSVWQNQNPSTSKIAKPILKKNGDIKEQLDVKLSKNIFAALNEKETIDSPESPSVETPQESSVHHMSNEQAKNKIDAMIAEWWCNFDMKEIKLTLEELEGSNYNSLVIDSFFNATMERKLPDVQKTVDLFSTLFNDSIFTAEELIKGSASQIEFAEDNLPDAPQLFKHLGMLLGRLVLDGVLSLSSLYELFKPLLASRSRKPPAPRLLGELLGSIGEAGDEVLVEAFQADPIDLESFWPIEQRGKETLDTWMDHYGLFALKMDSNGDLEEQFCNFLGSHDELEEWINEHPAICQTSKFSLQLSSVVINYVASLTFFPPGSTNAMKITTDTYIKFKEILSSFMPILLKYLMGNAAKLSFLEAVVNCWEKVGQPEELLESLFRLVWDLDMIGVEIFKAYKDCPKSNEVSKRLVGWFKYMEHQTT